MLLLSPFWINTLKNRDRYSYKSSEYPRDISLTHNAIDNLHCIYFRKELLQPFGFAPETIWTVSYLQQLAYIPPSRLSLQITNTNLSGFLNHCNGADGIHNFGDLSKYGHVRQAKPRYPSLPWNKQQHKFKQQFISQGSVQEFDSLCNDR